MIFTLMLTFKQKKYADKCRFFLVVLVFQSKPMVALFIAVCLRRWLSNFTEEPVKRRCEPSSAVHRLPSFLNKQWRSPASLGGTKISAFLWSFTRFFRRKFQCHWVYEVTLPFWLSFPQFFRPFSIIPGRCKVVLREIPSTPITITGFLAVLFK